MPRVVVEKLTKQFGRDIIAVKDLSLEINDGEILVLAGPSGCGKTTTLRMIAGLESPSRGKVSIGDREVTTLAPRHRNVSMVFQDAALLPHLYVRHNLEFGLRLRKLSRSEIDRRVDHVAALLEIEHLLTRRPRELSGGQRGRVAVGRALVHDADCYLLDEPLSHLDANARRELRVKIKDVHRETAATMIYVTHDQQEAMALGDRIAILRDGELQQIATPLDCYTRPANRFVAGFVGDARMNFIDGVLVKENDSLLFRGGDDVAVRLPSTTATTLASANGISNPKNVVLGIRPEAVRFAADDSVIQTAVEIGRGLVRSSEPLGDRTDLLVEVSPQETIRVRRPSRETASVGGEVSLICADADLHFFANDECGKNLLIENR